MNSSAFVPSLISSSSFGTQASTSAISSSSSSSSWVTGYNAKGKRCHGLLKVTSSSKTIVSKVADIADEQFEAEVLKSDIPVLVDFHAQWCGPCKLVAPLLDLLQNEYSGKLKVVKVDTEAHPRFVKNYKIYGLPTLVLFENGENIAQHEGAIGKKGIQDFISLHLPSLKAAS